MILNPEKYHYMNLGKDFEGDLLRFCEELLEASQIETVLGIQIDNKLNFENHIKSLCSKAFQKWGITKIPKSVTCAKEKSSVQLLPTGMDVLLKTIKLSSQQCS